MTVLTTPLDGFHINESYVVKTNDGPYSFYVTLQHKKYPISVTEKIESKNVLTEIEKSNCLLAAIRHIIIASRFGIIGSDEVQYKWDQGLNRWYNPSKLPEDDKV